MFYDMILVTSGVSLTMDTLYLHFSKVKESEKTLNKYYSYPIRD